MPHTNPRLSVTTAIRSKPARLVGGVTLIMAPLLWTAGLAMQWFARHRADLTAAELHTLEADLFAAPMLLAVHERQPGLSTAGWTLLTLGIILLVPAVWTLGSLVSVRAPWLGQIGATLMVAGLMARMFYLGVDATAFNLVERLGAATATPLAIDGYGELAYAFWRVPVIASVGTIVGSLVIAIAAFASGMWGTLRSLLILPAGWLGMGVLKEHEPGIGGIALALALIPTGIVLLRGGELRRWAPLHREASAGTRLRGLLSW